MTDHRPGSGARSASDSMRAVSHTARQNPRNVFGEMFRRGQVIQADGGRNQQEPPRKSRESAESSPDPDEDPEMREVDHETPDDAGVSRVWNRGIADDDEE